MSKVDYDEMGEYFNKSGRTMQRWENEKPQKFSLMLDEFNDSKEALKPDEIEVIVAANLKGGVGKSTISEAFRYYLGDAIILNVDISQPTEEGKSHEIIDYINYMEEHSVADVVRELSKKYKYIIIDTPGEATKAVHEAMSLSTKIIIPMTIGKKSREKTRKTLETFFEEGTDIKGDYNLYFFFNAYINKKKRKIASELFLKMYNEFKSADSIKLNSKLGALDYSDAISTAEEEDKSIYKLAEEKPYYKPILSKIHTVCSNIEGHLLSTSEAENGN